MDIIHKNVYDLTSTEYKACYIANYGMLGVVQECLRTCRDKQMRQFTGEVIMLWDGPKDSTKSLIGWALLTPVSHTSCVSPSNYARRKSKYVVQLWVKGKYRRRGYGKMLMNEVIKLDKNPYVMPHDDISSALFLGYDVTASKRDRSLWLKKGAVA